MRVLVVAGGSGGVIFAVTPLALALRDAGHQVLVATPENTVATVTDTGLPARARIAERLRRYYQAGATMVSVMVSAAATDLVGRLAILRGCAEAAADATPRRQPVR